MGGPPCQLKAKAQTKTKARTGFMDLSHEIRQKILFYTYEEPEPKPEDSNIYIEVFLEHKPQNHINSWTLTLDQVHPGMQADVHYVATKRWEDFGKKKDGLKEELRVCRSPYLDKSLVRNYDIFEFGNQLQIMRWKKAHPDRTQLRKILVDSEFNLEFNTLGLTLGLVPIGNVPENINGDLDVAYEYLQLEVDS
jgi:hypothetical protein